MKQFSENIPGQNCLNQLKSTVVVRFVPSERSLPYVKPGFAALAIFTFINTWNDYFMQLVRLHVKT